MFVKMDTFLMIIIALSSEWLLVVSIGLDEFGSDKTLFLSAYATGDGFIMLIDEDSQGGFLCDVVWSRKSIVIRKQVVVIIRQLNSIILIIGVYVFEYLNNVLNRNHLHSKRPVNLPTVKTLTLLLHPWILLILQKLFLSHFEMLIH